MSSQSPLQSQRTSPSAVSNLRTNVGSFSQPIDGKALASRFAYGQALTVKHNEFEKATAV